MARDRSDSGGCFEASLAAAQSPSAACLSGQEQTVPVLTASDLTANSLSAKACEPQKTADEARWRSGYAPDCKSEVARHKSSHFSGLHALFYASFPVGKSARLLTSSPSIEAEIE